MNAATLIAVTAFGGVCGLDRTAFGQTLLAHPMIAASLAGAIAGDFGAGLVAGIVISAISAPVLPVGERSIRDWTSAAVVLAASAAALEPAEQRGAVLILVLGLAWLGGRVIHGVRAHAGRVLTRRRERPATERLDGLEREHLQLVALHGLRGALVVGTATWAMCTAIPAFIVHVPQPEFVALAGVWKVAPLVGLPLLLRFHAEPGRLWPFLAVGIVLGCLALWWGPQGVLHRVWSWAVGS